MTVIMELKLLADVGLVGFPNAGKSTLLSSISAAIRKLPIIRLLRSNPIWVSFPIAVENLCDGGHTGYY